jgi:hypothetical protein
MSDTGNRRLINSTILILFILFLAIPIMLIIAGVMWSGLSKDLVVFWLTLNTVGGSIAAGIVFIYSLERYKQEHLFRDLLLVMICISAIITGVLYLLTNPAFVDLSPIVDRNRNRVIVLFGALIIAASPLMGSIVSEEPIRRGERFRILLMNGLVGPILALYALLTPVQLIIMSSPELGAFQFTLEAFILFGLLNILLVASMVKSFRAYLVSRVSIHLALGLLMALLIVAGILVSMVTNPVSVLEVSWQSAYIEGFALISISFMMDVVVDPFRALKKLVMKRTQELEESKRESEYYLNIWTHKVGNLLQGLHLYLELVNSSSDQQEVRKYSQSSLALVNDVDAINRQVRILSRIKGKQTEDLFRVSINEAIKAAIYEIEQILADSAPEIAFSELEHDDYVLGDDLLGTVPFNIIMYIIRYQDVGKPKISVSLSGSTDQVIVHIQYEGKRMSEDVQASLYDSIDPSRTTMGLDIFAVKLLLRNYGGSLAYADSPQGGQFIATVKRAPSKPSEGGPK